MKSLYPIVLSIFCSVLFVGCDNEDDEVGPIKSGGTFAIAVPEIGRSLAQGMQVSENNQHIYLHAVGSVSNDLFYSSDGGETFSKSAINVNGNYIIDIDNNGAILTSGGAVILADGTNMSSSISGYDYILGDNGKIFAYSQYGEFKYRTTTEFDLHDVSGISVTAGNFKVVKAPGKGFAVIQATSGNTPMITANVIDEQSLDIAAFTVTIDRNQINGCNSLNAFMGYNFQRNNILVVKGCTGFAMCDLTSGTVEYVSYPDVESAVYTDLRDYPLQMDAEGNFYIMYSTYAQSTMPKVYRYDGSDFSELTDFISLSNGGNPFIVRGNNLYFNSKTIQGTSLAGMTRWDISNESREQLTAVIEPMPISDAVAIDVNNLLLVADNDLFKYNAATSELSRFSNLSNVTHVNILSDGKWIAGGMNKLYSSTNKGSSWELSDDLFASTGNGYAVNGTRMVNGEILIVGTNQSTYYNQSTGMWVDQYANAAVTGNGMSWSEANYAFPGDFQLSTITPEGIIYGGVQFIDPFTYQPSIIPKIVRPGVLSAEDATQGIPMLVTDAGEQIRLFAPTSYELEVQTRAGDNGEWQGTGSKFVSDGLVYGNYQITLANNILTLVYHSEVYVLK